MRDVSAICKQACGVLQAKQWKMHDALQQRIRFDRRNLAEPGALEAPQFEVEAKYHLILCRNLFIYLGPQGPRRARAVACVRACSRRPAGDWHCGSCGRAERSFSSRTSPLLHLLSRTVMPPKACSSVLDTIPLPLGPSQTLRATAAASCQMDDCRDTAAAQTVSGAEPDRCLVGSKLLPQRPSSSLSRQPSQGGAPLPPGALSRSKTSSRARTACDSSGFNTRICVFASRSKPGFIGIVLHLASRSVHSASGQRASKGRDHSSTRGECMSQYRANLPQRANLFDRPLPLGYRDESAGAHCRAPCRSAAP